MYLFRDLSVWASRVRECRDPRLLASALNHDQQRARLLALATGRPTAISADYLREVEDDAPFLTEVRGKMAQWTPYTPRAVDFMMVGRSGSVFFNEVTLYAIVRALRPAIVVETGGTPGKSTAFILRAMERNGAGHLYTIDLPPAEVEGDKLLRRETYHQQRPVGAGSGWIVPAGLRGRHTTLLGKSSEHLPPLLKTLAHVDIFYHDSDHSYQNMTWEFETAWPRLQPGGLLLSDDVLANSSFFDFCRQHDLVHCNVFNLGAAFARS